MPDKAMTLIERLRNPEYRREGSPYDQAVLVTERTRRDMMQAADEIDRLQKAIGDMAAAKIRSTRTPGDY